MEDFIKLETHGKIECYVRVSHISHIDRENNMAIVSMSNGDTIKTYRDFDEFINEIKRVQKLSSK